MVLMGAMEAFEGADNVGRPPPVLSLRSYHIRLAYLVKDKQVTPCNGTNRGMVCYGVRGSSAEASSYDTDTVGVPADTPDTSLPFFPLNLGNRGLRPGVSGFISMPASLSVGGVGVGSGSGSDSVG